MLKPFILPGRREFRAVVRLVPLLSLLIGAVGARAADGTWTNTFPADTNVLTTVWSDATNWLNGAISSGANSTAFFNTIDLHSNTGTTTNSTMTVLVDYEDAINFFGVTNANIYLGDTVTTDGVGNWILADSGLGFPLTLENLLSPDSIIDVNLARGTTNNLALGWGTASITANLAGTNTLVKSGPSHLILNPTVGNSHSGGMVISNGMVQLGVANAAGTANASAPGPGPIIFRGGSLRLQNAAIPGNNPGNGGAGITALANPIIVEAGQVGTLYMSPRAFPANTGPVTGGGTLNLVVDFVRDNLGGDWSGFTGVVNVASSTRQSSDLRFSDPFVAAGGWANARVAITTNGVNANTVNMYNNGTGGGIIRFGELSAVTPNIVNIFANNTGAGAGNSLPFVLQVGELNTDASFSGNFAAAGVANGIGIIKEGTGTWILNGLTIENNGIVLINNGTLQIGSGTSGKLGRTAIVTNNATLAFGRTDTALVVTNVIDGPGTLLQRGSGRTTLSPSSGANTYTGKTVVTNGTLAASSQAALGATPGGFVADQLTLNGGSFAATTSLSINDVNRGITLGAAGGGLGADGANTLTVANVIGGAGNLTINNTGTVAPTGANNYTGKTILQSGTLSLATESVLGTAPGIATADQITFSGGTLRSSATFSIDDANRGITVGSAGGTISPDASTTLTIVEAIAGTGTLTKSGAGNLIINAAGTLSGPVAVSQGTLALGASGSLPNASSFSTSGGVLDATASGGLTLGAGQTLTGNSSVTGDVVAGSGSFLSPGTSVGVLNISGNLTLSGGATYINEISSTTNDLINVTGNLNLAGLNTVSLTLLSSIPVGDYTLIKYGGTLSGGTNNLALAGYPPSRLVPNFVNNLGNKSIDLNISGTAGTLVWQGGLGGNAWDVVTTSNWLNGASGDVFYNGDTVTFNDTGAANPNVNLVGSLGPASATVNSTTDYTFAGSGKITGVATLVKDGANKLTVLTTNDYAGTTTINSGTLQVGNGTASGALGTGNITDNASLVYNLPDSRTVAAQISGGGSLSVEAGTVILTGNNSYGASSISGGATLQVGNGGASGSLGTGGVSDDGALVYNRTGTVTNSGAISGNGSLAVNAGTVALSANNSYAGPTTINNGTLRVGIGGTSGTLGSAGAVTVSTGGTLAFNRSDDLTNVVNVIGAGALSQMGPGTLVITNDGNAYGATAVTGGRLHLGDGANASGRLGNGTITVTSPGTLAVCRPDTYLMSNVIAGSGFVAYLGPSNSITVPAGPNTYTGGTTLSNTAIVLVAPVTAPTANGIQSVNGTAFGTGGTITFLGNSSVTLAAANAQDPEGNGTGNFGQPISVAAGQTANFFVPGRFTFSSAVSGAGTINYGANYVRGDVTGNWTNFTGQLNVMTNAVNATGTTLWDFRVFTTVGFPNARVHLVAPMTMYWRGAANSVVPIGELSSEVGSTLTALGGAEGGNAVTWRVGRLNTDATFAGTIAGTVAVGLIKEGTGKWTLTAPNTFIGNTAISNGVLALATGTLGEGDIASSANIRVVSPGVLDATGRSDATFHLANTMLGDGTNVGHLEVNGTLAPGLSIGTFTVTGNATLNGTLNVEVNRVAAPSSDRLSAQNITLNNTVIVVTNLGTPVLTGDTFQILQANGGIISGTVSSVTGGVPPGGSWDTSNLLVNGTITAFPPPSPVLTNAISGGGTTLDFSWGTEYLGWRLYSQTNTINVGLSTNWVPVLGTESLNQTTIVIDPANGAAFYRLSWP